MRGYQFKGRIQSFIKYESGRIVVMGGYLLENQKIMPVNQIVSVFKDATGQWTVKHLKFEDEQFRQPYSFYPFCYVPYSSWVP